MSKVKVEFKIDINGYRAGKEYILEKVRAEKYKMAHYLKFYKEIE